MNTWSIDSFVTNLATVITSDTAWMAMDPAVTVFDYFPSKKQQNGDWLAVGTDIDDNPAKVILDGGTRSRDEAESIQCLLGVRRGGSGSTTAGTARSQAVTAIHHIDRLLRITPTAALFGEPVVCTVKPHISNRKVSQWATDDNGVAVRVAVVAFTISYAVRTTPT